jgi:hypothetical protein
VYAGTAPTFSAVNSSDTVSLLGVDPGKVFVVYKNTNASGRTITITPGYNARTPYPEATNSTVTFSLAGTNGERWIPMHPDYADSSGIVTIAIDATTNVTSALIKIDWLG